MPRRARSLRARRARSRPAATRPRLRRSARRRRPDHGDRRLLVGAALDGSQRWRAGSIGRPRRERGSAKLRTWPHCARRSSGSSAGTARQAARLDRPERQRLPEGRVVHGRDRLRGRSGAGSRDVKRRVGVVQRLVRAVVPAGGDRGRGDPVPERRRRAAGRAGEVGRVAERTQLTRQERERPAQVRAERRAPEQQPVGGVADRCVAGGRALRRSSPPRRPTSRRRRRRGRAPAPARSPRRPEHVDRRLVPDRRDRAAAGRRRAGRQAVRGRRPRRARRR